MLLLSEAHAHYTKNEAENLEITMRKIIFSVITFILLQATANSVDAADRTMGLYEVVGVKAGDMLKMRAGPGTGYKIILGLPNETIVRVHTCDQTGGTRWCKASLKKARGLVGYVSWAYLSKM